MVFVTQKDFGGLGPALQNIGTILGGALQKRGESQNLQNILNPQAGAPQESPQLDQQFLDIVQSYENETGESLEPTQLDFLWRSTQQQSQKQGTPRYSTAQLAAIAEKNAPLASLIQQQQLADQKIEQKESAESTKRAFEENKPFVEQMNKVREGLATKDINLFRINEALDSGNVKTWQNFMADYFDNEFIRSAEGAELLSAVKEEFISDMSQMPPGTRLNQYLEKNMREALQTIGKDPKSNRIITAFQEFKLDLNKEKLKIYDNTRNSYLDKGLEPPRNLQFMVDAQLKEYTNKKQKEFTKDVRDIRSGKIKSIGGLALEEARKRVKGVPPENGHTWMISPYGELVQIPNVEIKRAENSGGRRINGK